MKKLSLSLLMVLMVLMVFQSITAQTVRSIANPQLNMVGARVISLGGTNPVVGGDINSVMINPSAIAGIESMPLAVSSQRVIGFFDNKLINFSLPFEIALPINEKTVFQKFTVGISYGSNALDGIPKTTSEDQRVRQIGDFSSGFNVLQASAATSFYDVFGFKILSPGAALKWVNQYVDSKSRSALGLDVGLMGTYQVNYPFIDNVHIGASVLNLVATPLVWNDTKDEASLPTQFFVGGRVDMFDETLALFAHNAVGGFSVGAEYLLQNSLVFRGSTDLKRLSLGTGLKFENVAGFGYNSYSVRLDYSYTQNPAPFENDPNHVVSLSVLGETRPQTPKLLTPATDTILTQDKTINLGGIGPRNTTIQIYNNGSMSRSLNTNRVGNWTFDKFPLAEGQNVIFVRAFSLESDASFDSQKITVTSDTLPPSLDIKILPEDKVIRVVVSSDEDLNQLNATIEDNRLRFYKNRDYVWEAEIPLPESMVNNSRLNPTKMQSLQVFARDKVGNQGPIQQLPFFMTVDFPSDKYVHYKEDLRFIGESSKMVKNLSIDDTPVYVDSENKFQATKRLRPGKNLVKVFMTGLNDKVFTYTLRILRLKTFPDLDKRVKERREIEFLATLDVLDGEPDGNFYPDRPVTRMYITRLMVRMSKVPLQKVTADLFPDVPKAYPGAQYIQAAIQNGLIFAYPDGTFKPDQPLTLSEVGFLLSNAGIIGDEEVTKENRPITRKELALFLAYNPKFEARIDTLIDWEKGYK
ncbi:MAG: S-layer homology domain-containing protein [Candidatus Margulisiibacteriota bacterium]